MKAILFFILTFFSISLIAQNGHTDHLLKGLVYEKDSSGLKKPLSFANVYWQQSLEGVITDSLGRFNLHKPHEGKNLDLIVSFIGFKTDTISIDKTLHYIEIGLSPSVNLGEVVIAKNQSTIINSKISLMQTQMITEGGLQKLACCNIGESFESNATIDVGFSDAISGAKKIRMLGLDGKYSQFLFENIPFMRGPESGYGLNHIPGPFMQSIQVSKGTSSVLNGYESTTGQINVEYKKPSDTDLLYINLFGNSEGRYESNVTSGLRLNEKWAGMVLFHASNQNIELDHNSDGFMDKPLQKQYNFLNRWEYSPDGFLHLQFGIELLKEDRLGGELGYRGRDNNPAGLYGIDVNINKLRLFSKLGFAFPKDPDKSIGWINSFTYFDQKALFGNKEYNGKVKNYYTNLIWQTRIRNESNLLSSGLSFQYDDYNEYFINRDFLRTEMVQGIFSQYTYSVPEKLVFMTGVRLDYNSQFSWLFTPRLHFKYDVNDHLILRSTLGRAFRSPNVFAENLSLLASSRNFVFDNNIGIEKAWNAGISLSREFHLPDQRDVLISLDLYRTDFQDQMIVDLDNINEVKIYNLDGRSYSNSFQADLSGEIFKSFDMTLAYRYNDVRAQYRDGMRALPFSIKHKFLFTTTYSTRFDKWKFDLTVQRNGVSRIPDSNLNPEEFRLDAQSPAYFIVHTQVTKKFKHFELYSGIENLTAYRQKEAIIDAENPFGEYFDATMVWGPLTGRMFYGGLRFKLNNH